VDLLMEKKENSSFLLYFSLSVTAIFLAIFLFATSTIFIALGLNQNQIAIAQQQQQEFQNNQTSSTSSLVKQSTLGGISFDIDNMTFPRHTASVNGIQTHYVIGGQGDAKVDLTLWEKNSS
jgi:hypothetical protein